MSVGVGIGSLRCTYVGIAVGDRCEEVCAIFVPTGVRAGGDRERVEGTGHGTHHA